MTNCQQGIQQMLRGYYYHKSADWEGNQPFRLAGWQASELAKMPTYYIMDADKGMAETSAEHFPSQEYISSCTWLTEKELAVYAAEYARTGFQGGLNWYRCATNPGSVAELQLFSGRSIDVPSCFIAGTQDWGTYKLPGENERMVSTACSNMIGYHLVDRAGHWVQQEQPEEVVRLLLDFLAQIKR